MLKKNIEKQERAARRQTFIGIRPTRFKKKTAYNRKVAKNESRKEIYQTRDQPYRKDRALFIIREVSLLIGRPRQIFNAIFRLTKAQLSAIIIIHQEKERTN